MALKKNIWRTLPVNVSQAMTGFLSIIAFTHILSPAEYGQFAIAQAVMMISYVLVFKWLDATCTRYHVRMDQKGELPPHFATVYGSYFVLAAVFLGLSFVVIRALPFDPVFQLVLHVAAVAGTVRGGIMIGIESHLAAAHYGRYTVIEGANVWLGLAAGVSFALLGFGGAAPVLGLATGALIMFGFDLPRMLGIAKGGRFQWDRFKRYAHYGVPLAWAMVLTLLLTSIDRFFLAAYFGDSTLGPYAAGYNLSQRLMELVFLAVWLGGYPTAVRALEQDGMEAARTVLRDFAEVLILVATPAAAGLALVAYPLAVAMTGATFEVAASQIIPFAALAAWLAGWLNYYFNMAFAISQNTRVLTLVNLAAVLSNVALNALLTPRYGPMGALASAVGALLVGLGLSIWFGRKELAMPLPLVDMGKSLAGCAVMAVGVSFVPMDLGWGSLMGGALVGAGLYGASAVVLNTAKIRTAGPHLVRLFKGKGGTP